MECQQPVEKNRVIQADKGTIRAGQYFLMPPHPWNDFEIYKFCQNKHAANQEQWRFNGVYSRNSLPKIEDRAYVTNLDKYTSIGTHLIALHMNVNNITCFDSFGAEHVPKEIKKLMNNQNITNIYRIWAHDSIMCTYFCIGVIDFLCFRVKTLQILELHFHLTTFRKIMKQSDTIF